MPAQAGTVYRYFRADADHDISGDPIALSLDGGTTWITTGVDYIAPGALPPGPAAVNAGTPPKAGFAGYWWRVLTGPTTSFPLARGLNAVVGKLTDSPEVPHFGWRVTVDATE
jgi:hypothetical protein